MPRRTNPLITGEARAAEGVRRRAGNPQPLMAGRCVARLTQLGPRYASRLTAEAQANGATKSLGGEMQNDAQPGRF